MYNELPDINSLPILSIEKGTVKTVGEIDGIIFGVSCDGGKTAVAWRKNVFEAFEYLELQNKNGITKYAVVAIKA